MSTPWLMIDCTTTSDPVINRDTTSSSIGTRAAQSSDGRPRRPQQGGESAPLGAPCLPPVRSAIDAPVAAQPTGSRLALLTESAARRLTEAWRRTWAVEATRRLSISFGLSVGCHLALLAGLLIIPC